MYNKIFLIAGFMLLLFATVGLSAIVDDSAIQQGAQAMNETTGGYTNILNQLPVDSGTLIMCLVWIVLWFAWKDKMFYVGLLAGLALILVLRGIITI